MVSRSSVTKAASAAAVMSVIAVPSVVMAQQPGTAAPAAVVHPIQDMTIAQGSEKTIYLNDYLSNLSSYKVTSKSVSGVVYATYSYLGSNPLSLRGDQVGSSMVTISNDTGKLEEFKVHVLDAGADKRIDIGDVTKYIAAHPVDVTQAADVRTLLNGIEPLNNTSAPTPGVNGKPNPIVLVAGQTETQAVPMASYFTKTAEESLKFNAKSSYDYIHASIDQAGVLTLTGTSALGQYVGTSVEIQVIATNQYEKSVTLNVPVTIQAGNIPVVKGTPNPINWKLGVSTAQTISMATYFSSDSPLTYSLENLPSTIFASINEDTGQLVIQGVQAASDGSEVFQVKATNKFGSVSVSLTVQFTVKRNPIPVVVGLPDPIQWIVGQSEPQTVSMATYIVTEPDSPLTYRIKSKSAYIDAAIDELTGRLTMNSVNLSSLPTDTPFIQVAATNTYNNSAMISIPVLFEYLAPEVTSNPDPIEWIVGATEAQILNASEFFMDRSGPGTHLTYSLENLPSTLTVAINQDTGRLVIQGVQTVTGGSEVFQVKATNPFGKSASISLKLNIIAPYTIQWKKDDPMNYPNPYFVPLSTFFDSTGATAFEILPLSWESHVSVSVANNHTEQAQLVFEGIMGDTTFTVLGTNPTTGISKERTILFVTDYAPPTIEKEAEHVTVSNGREYGEGYPLFLNQYFKSSDSGDNLQYSIVEDTNLSGEVFAVLRGSEDNRWIEFIGAYFPDNITTTTVVKVKATNMYGKSAVLDIPVTVEAAPPPMVAGNPTPISYTDGLATNAFQIENLYEFFRGNELDLAVDNVEELKSQYHTSAGIDGGDLFVEVQSPLGNHQPVTFYVKVKATDRFNQSALLNIPFTVNPNAAPVLDPDGINTIYLDHRDGMNLIDLDLLGLFTDVDADKGDKLNYTLEVTSSIQGDITSDHYMTLSGSSIDMGATVKVSAQDKAGNVINKTISVQSSPLGESNVDRVYSNSVITVIYPDTILPALATDDKSKAIYLVDINNPNNISYNAYHMSNDNYVNIMNGSSLNYPVVINLHYVNKVDHTLTLDVFPIFRPPA
ncbi:hypothetical protein [Paenibacillus sp. RC67]|uniref:hypothetical protein n=1 Tax=Paenibacillus sp. RC67 TaxID=3039392 RepID=UPI0024AE75BD|nr:hypothetical protein [Paenibacillus sp. RC67]